MRRLRFVWIDDKQEKIRHYAPVIEEGVGRYRAVVEPFLVRADFLEALSEWSTNNKSSPPDLFIIDHIYNFALPFDIRGSSVAHLLRREFPITPMVCVTSMYDRPDTFDQDDISEYLALFLYQDLANHIEDLYAIARDFVKLEPGSTALREHLVASLKAPTRERERLVRILPEEFQNGAHSSTMHRAARWIANTFLARPGFVYDQLHAATLLGLTEAGFEKIKAQFRVAQYSGVFATHRSPRWWVDRLRTRLFELVAPDAPDVPQYAGRTLKGISEADYSRCYVSKKVDPAPDAVVLTDATGSAKARVVQRTFSDRHPLDPGITPGFETRLILRRTAK